MTQPLVLFGGTFDPVHQAHVAGALAVSRLLGEAPVYLVPNAHPPHREQPGTSAQDRMTMLELACGPYPSLAVEDWELRQEGPSWTVLTLAHFRQQAGHRPLVLVIGADSHASLSSWHEWHALPGLCHLVVLPRPGAGQPDPAVREAFEDTVDPQALLLQPAGLRLLLDSPVLDVSSTSVRDELARQGDSTQLDPAVMAHIRARGLYNVSQSPASVGSKSTPNHDGNA